MIRRVAGLVGLGVGMACIGALRIEGVVLLEDSNKGAFAVLLSSRAAQKHCKYDYRDISFRCHVFFGVALQNYKNVSILLL